MIDTARPSAGSRACHAVSTGRTPLRTESRSREVPSICCRYWFELVWSSVLQIRAVFDGGEPEGKSWTIGYELPLRGQRLVSAYGYDTGSP
jgi:hypothetical protein